MTSFTILALGTLSLANDAIQNVSKSEYINFEQQLFKIFEQIELLACLLLIEMLT